MDTVTRGRKATENVLAHVGVKGMKWGVRRSRAERRAAREESLSPDAQRARANKETVKKNGLGALDNKELEHLVNRMNLEQRYGKLKGDPIQVKAAKKGGKFVGEAVGNIAKTQVTRIGNEQAAKQLAKLLAKNAG